MMFSHALTNYQISSSCARPVLNSMKQIFREVTGPSDGWSLNSDFRKVVFLRMCSTDFTNTNSLMYSTADALFCLRRGLTNQPGVTQLFSKPSCRSLAKDWQFSHGSLEAGNWPNKKIPKQNARGKRGSRSLIWWAPWRIEKTPGLTLSKLSDEVSNRFKVCEDLWRCPSSGRLFRTTPH